MHDVKEHISCWWSRAMDVFNNTSYDVKSHEEMEYIYQILTNSTYTFWSIKYGYSLICDVCTFVNPVKYTV